MVWSPMGCCVVPRSCSLICNNGEIIVLYLKRNECHCGRRPPCSAVRWCLISLSCVLPRCVATSGCVLVDFSRHVLSAGQMQRTVASVSCAIPVPSGSSCQRVTTTLFSQFEIPFDLSWHYPIKNRDFCQKALPHYLLIFLCRHREMYYYFIHLLRFHFLS